MSQKIVNLTLPVITHKVKAALDLQQLNETSTPVSVQQPASAIALQEKLVAYVLRRMPRCYITTEKTTDCSLASPSSCFSAAQHRQMDDLIQEGLRHLLSRRSSWEVTSQDAPQGVGSAPSHWFG